MASSVIAPRGIDVSHYQGTVDWHQVAQAGAVFTFVKATDGLTFLDPMFQSNWAGAKAAGLLRGAYHFFEPDDDPEQQAQWFLKNVPLAAGDLPAALDVEKPAEAEAIQTWLTTVEQATGRTPLLYTSPGVWSPAGTQSFGGYPLWVADYEVVSPTLPAGWSDWIFWQYTQSGHVPGIQGTVDLDVFQGTLEQLQQMVK